MMKNLKYIALFEAFESLKIQKTLSYINNDSVNNFINSLKSTTEYLDFPLSKLSDDNFEYLSYRKALKYGIGEDVSVLSYVKFWFSASGKYITTTVVDGRNITGDLFEEFSRLIEDYEIGKQIELYDLEDLPMGTKILLESKAVSYLFKSEGTETFKYYLLQDVFDGSQPYNFDYRRIARYSWAIGNTSDYTQMNLLYSKKVFSGDDEEYLSKNPVVKFRGDKYSLSPSTHVLRDAHFALVLKVRSMNSSKKLKDIKSEREESKSGAFLTDKEIKKANIDRYITKLTSGYYPERIIKRIISPDVLYLLYTSDIADNLSYVIELYFKYLKDPSGENEERLKNILRDIIKKNMDNRVKFAEYKKDLISQINKLNPDEKSVYSEQLSKLDELSRTIYNRLTSNKIETIYDMETIWMKLSSIKTILSNPRNMSRRLNEYFLQYTLNKQDILVTFSGTYNSIDDAKSFNAEGYVRLKELFKRL